MEVQVVGNSGFIWNIEDALKLRKNHRILGCFVGFTPKTFEEDLPLVLLPEEMQLLKEKSLIKIIKLKDSKAPNEKLVKRLQVFFFSKHISLDKYFRALEYKEKMYQTQIEEFKSERVEVMIGYLQSHVIIFFRGFTD